MNLQLDAQDFQKLLHFFKTKYLSGDLLEKNTIVCFVVLYIEIITVFKSSWAKNFTYNPDP